MGKLVRYVEGLLQRKPRFHKFAEKQPKCLLYRGIIKRFKLFGFLLSFFCGVTSPYPAFGGRNDYRKLNLCFDFYKKATVHCTGLYMATTLF